MKNWHKNHILVSISVYLAVVSALYAPSLTALGPFSALFSQEWDTAHSFTKQVEKNIEELKKRRAEASEQQGYYKSLLENTQKRNASFKERAQRVRGTELEYVNQELAIATKTAQVLSEITQVYQDLKGTIDAHIKLLTDYKADPEFKNKGYQPEQKSIYSIDDFQKINTIILAHEAELKNLEDRLKKIAGDYDTLKRNQHLARQEYEEKKKEQRELKSKEIPEERPERKKLSLKQRGELLDAEERLLGFKKDLADLKVREIDQRAQYIEQSAKIIKLQLEVLETEAEQVRKELRVDKKDLNAAQNALKNQVAESTRLQEDYAKRIESLNLLRQSELNQINQLKQRYHVSESDAEAFYQWAYQPSSMSEWNALIDIGRLHDHIILEIDMHKDMLLASIEKEKTQVTEAEANYLIIQSWYNLTAGKFEGYATSELVKEIKQYEKIKADIQSSISALTDKAAAASNALTANTRIVEGIKARIKTFKEQRDTVFKNNPEEYARLAKLLGKVFNEAQQRGEFIASLIEVYSNLNHGKEMTIKKIDTMIGVLTSKTQWKSGPQLWKGLKRFVPDMTKFVQYVFEGKNIGQSFAANQKAVSSWLGTIKTAPSTFFSLLLYILILFLIFLLLRLYLPELALFFSHAVPAEYGIAYVISSFFATLSTFIVSHLRGLYLWLLAFLLVRWQIVDTYLGVLFYLVSIPLSIYYIHRFIIYLKAVNSARGYVFASKRYQQRFFLVISIFFYATVTIFFFRQALLRVFPKADAPNTLLALNFILLQVSLILIISREQVLRLIPRTTPLWEWVYEHLNKYYYLFLAGLIFIIVMSNPYIGYGATFFYAITRLILIALLIPFFMALHNRIKQWSGSFFFYSDEEGIKERFRYGRSAYGLFVIGSFLCLTLFALIVAINIWGYPVGFEDIITWLRKGIYGYTNPSTGRHVEVNAFHLIRVFLYILGAIAAAYLINKFVFKRMFELLLVNVGVQNAILSLTKYSIIIAAIVIGLSSIGLNYSLLYIFAVLGGLGVAGKEIITDFIGYFIILIQRPLKIGDFIRFDTDLTGFVRHLTLRSIIIRKNNSVTIIIPNSFVLNKSLTNWNYSRTYFGFEDIFVTVVYAADPAKVKKLILEVLDSNINILKNPAPVVRLHDFTDNGFIFQVRGFLSPDKVVDMYDIASDVRLELVRVLRAQGLDIGSPTRMVTVRPGPKELEMK